MTVDGQQIGAGDPVRFTATDKKLGVKNGYTGVVGEVVDRGKKSTLRVVLDGEGERRQVVVPLKAYDHVQLAYADTTHVRQGATIARGYVLLGGSLTDRHMSYVQGTRAVLGTKFYADEQTAGKGLERLTRQMSRERLKEFARDVERKVQAQAEDQGPRPAGQTASTQRTGQRVV